MASDDPTAKAISGIQLSYSSADLAEVTRAFDALAEGGEVSQPVAETFFSPAFGMCVDQFGTPWMSSAHAPQPPE